jgi:hypothetical protein
VEQRDPVPRRDDREAIGGVGDLNHATDDAGRPKDEERVTGVRRGLTLLQQRTEAGGVDEADVRQVHQGGVALKAGVAQMLAEFGGFAAVDLAADTEKAGVLRM